MAIVQMDHLQGLPLCLDVTQALDPQDGAAAAGKSSCSSAPTAEAQSVSYLGSEPLSP